jgi:N-acetylneuraminate 9-O-acetyltransferase
VTVAFVVQMPGYPLANFLLCSLLYIGVSHRLFILTNTLKNAFVPHDDNAKLGRNAVLIAACAAVLYVVAWPLHSFLYSATVGT